MTAQSTTVMVGNREDLTDMIWDVSPSDTPVLSAMKKGKASNTLHEWQTDSLASPNGDNKAVEGAASGTPDDDPTIRMGNYTQILTKDAKVTGTQETGMNHAGIKGQMAKQIAKKLKEIKTDCESSMIGVNNAKEVGGVSTAREMGSITSYLYSNTDFNATGGADPTGTGTTSGSTARTDGTQRVFTEALLTSALSSAFDNGGDPKLLVCGSFNKGKVSGFVGGGTSFVDKSEKKLVNSVDIYVGDFSTLSVVPSRHVRARDVLILDPEYLSCNDLRGVSTKDIASTGDYVKKQVVWETTLKVCNEAAHAAVFDLTTS
ncbi:MAG: DUF5309 domain-containing protein [Alteromonas sp.]|nr:DUF5309 domain-containing protein [Alteromonas sp.]